MKPFLALCLWGCLQTALWSQDGTFTHKPPIFPGCENVQPSNLKACFDTRLFTFIKTNFTLPETLDSNFTGEVTVLFEVDKDGAFKIIFTEASHPDIKEEFTRIFEALPKITPASYNGVPTFVQYSVKTTIPIGSNPPISQPAENPTVASAPETKTRRPEPELTELEKQAKQEYEKIQKQRTPYTAPEYSSQLNIPFTHGYYAGFESSLNLVGTNSHTASKPYLYSTVNTYYDFRAVKDSLQIPAQSTLGKKLWNEHLVQVQSKDYWFTLDPVFDLQVGKDTEASFSTTFNNTRGIFIQGGLGKKLNFSATVYESQGRFAQYFNTYAESIKGADEAALIPGRGIAKRFKTDAYDYPVAEAYLSYTPAPFLNLQFGHGKNFIGDGYRSLFMSDVASPSPFLKLNTSFWKIKYTNTWMWLRDVRPEVTEDGAYLTKYMATHYLSWNLSKRFNLGLFESVVWSNTNNRGFDINYLNPIIFFRAIEFETGQGAGNAILGLSGKYKWNDNIHLYGQFILDEFSLDAVKAQNKNWKNKYGYQLGAKYYHAFKVQNLMLQAEYNRVRPYTYSHNTIIHNYGHNNQSMAHLWGANFSELILIGRYYYKRWQADAKIVLGTRGFDFNTETDTFSYGADIYRNYNDRPFDTGVEVGQGIKTNTFNAELQAAYIVNTATNLRLFANLSFRDFTPDAQTPTTFKSNTTWFTLGLRTDLFNWYFDF
ncbi:MAG TPA: gliding motility protein RemB [Flavobacteriaceae bacterium]|nr:gliding motility protein RemB [Flavobacteriaceae bacterium]